jgi:hypothetical protein
MGSPELQRCFDKAVECENRAEQAIDNDARNSYRRMAENWRLLAETHQKISDVEKVRAARQT